MNKMYVGFSTNEYNIISRFIRWSTNSNWSHCFIVYDVEIEGNAIIIESSFIGGVKFSLLSHYMKPTIKLELVEVKDHPIGVLLPFIGENYGVLQIITNGFCRLFGIKKNPLTKDTVCSELVYIWLKDAGYNVEGMEPNLVSPEEIYRMLKNGNDKD